MSVLPDSIHEGVARHTGSISHVRSIGGGCIANACRVTTNGASYFLKWGHHDVAQTFQAEADGLRALRMARSPLIIPQVIAVEEAANGQPGFLLMDWIESGSAGPTFHSDFGRFFAELHRHTAERYGFDSDNFIGRLPQRNTRSTSWPAFFCESRLMPQVEMARSSGAWQSGWDQRIDRLYDRLADLLPKRPEASILHGDLWSGNYMVTASGKAALVDPAAYYGHREADLAMTELFGRFDPQFYAGYEETWPLEPGYDERRQIYNLYHLINHLNHFGGSYARGVDAVLRQFG